MLRQRILSALVLAPVALVAAWSGSWPFVTLSALVCVLLAWEWTRLCSGRFGAAGAVISVSSVAACLSAQVLPWLALPVVAAGAVAAPLLDQGRARAPQWLIAGALYIGLSAFSLVWIREQGRETLLWLLLVVWATDIGAYAAGRTIGGPKLFARVSPKKTWAGLIGGMVSAAFVGVCCALVLGNPGPVALALASAALAVVAQAGDLAESAVKRYFGVKDSSNIIPGHGGVMDRLDGLLAAALPVAVLCLIFGGGLARW